MLLINKNILQKKVLNETHHRLCLNQQLLVAFSNKADMQIRILLAGSVTRLGDFLHFWQLFKSFGSK